MKRLVTAALFLIACGSSENEDGRERATPSDLPGFDVSYQKIATSFILSQNHDPDHFTVEFNSLHESEWEAFDGETQFTATEVKISGKGPACFFADQNHDLVRCISHDDSGVAVIRKKDGSEITQNIESFFVGLDRIERQTFSGAPQQPTVTTDVSIEVQMLLLTDNGSLSGTVSFPEQFGETTIR